MSTFRKLLKPPMTIEQTKSRQARASRRKGKRTEYSLRDFMRKCGWEANRVALSGAWSGAKGDVKATKGSKSCLLECKNHRRKWTDFWTMLEESTRITGDEVISVAVPTLEKQLVDIAYNLDAILDGNMIYPPMYHHPVYEKYKKTFKRLPAMYKYLGNSDILVIKDSFKPFIFFRFR